jgi:hypothetical protein
MRHVFTVLFDDQVLSAGAPLTIVATREDTFKQLVPTNWKNTGGNIVGTFYRGWEKQFAILVADSSEEREVVVFHEYTHSVLEARAHWLPVWLNEGLAEFYGYTRFERNRTLIGSASQRMDALQRGPLLPVSEMLVTSPKFRDGIAANLFYAESWAMVHYMTFGEGMGGGAKLNAFFKKLQDGESQTDAFKEVFGDTRTFYLDLSQYLKGFTLNAAVLPADPKIDASSFAVRKLGPAETEYELGCFQIGAHETKPGRERIKKALALDPKLAGAHEELGFLEFQEGKDAEAMKEWQQAVDLDLKRARSVFALAMMDVPLNAATPPQLHAMQGKLQHVVELSPDFAPAYIELALVDWRLGLLRQAFKNARKAEQLEPWRAGYQILSGHILLAGKQPEEAAKSARYVAERWTGPDHNEAVDLWSEVPTNARGEGVPLALDMPPGATVERGILTELTCASEPGVPTVFTLFPDTPGATPKTFKSDGHLRVGFSDTFWWGEDHFTVCHHLTGHHAIVANDPKDPHMLVLEVREDLPAVTSPSAPAAASAH